jgi:hypothetical protein
VAVICDAAQITFEVAIVYGVKADQRHKQAPVRLGDQIAHQISATCQALFKKIQGLEETAHTTVICGLCTGETSVRPRR